MNARTLLLTLVAWIATFATSAWLLTRGDSAIPEADLATPPALDSGDPPLPSLERSGEPPVRTDIHSRAPDDAVQVLGTGRVVDLSDEGVAGVKLVFRRTATPKDLAYARSGPVGQFAVTASYRATGGTYILTSATADILVAGRQRVELPTTEPIRVEIMRRQDSRGYVRDRVTHQGIEGIQVGRGRDATLTDRDGAFLLPGPWHTTLLISDPQLRYAGLLEAGPFGFGVDEQPVVELGRTQSIPIRVVERGSSRPIENFAVRSWPAAARDGFSGTRPPRRDSQGALMVDGLWPGRNHLVVIPANPSYADSSVIAVDPALLEGELQVELASRATLRARVVDSEGLGVAAIDVATVSLFGSTLPNYPSDVATTWLAPAQARSTRIRRPKIVSRSTTDANGFADLGIPNQFRNLAVIARVQTAERVHTYGTVMLDTARQFVTIRIPRGAPPQRAAPRLQPSATGTASVRIRVAGKVPPTHTVVVEDRLPYESARWRRRSGRGWPKDHGASDVFVREIHAPCTLEVRAVVLTSEHGRMESEWSPIEIASPAAGNVQEFSIDLPDFVPASGVVTIDGKQVTRGEVGVYVSGRRLDVAKIDPTTGRFAFRIVPVRAGLLLRLEPGPACAAGWWSPRRRSTRLTKRSSDFDLHLATRNAEFRMLTVDGQPMPNADFVARFWTIEMPFRSDRHGILRIEGLPPSGILKIRPSRDTLFTSRSKGSTFELALRPDQTHYQQDIIVTSSEGGPNLDYHLLPSNRRRRPR